MKLFALYPTLDLPNLEFNHRKYCDTHNIDYNKIILKDTGIYEIQKLYKICEILEENLGETCLFIDSYSYFQSFNELPEIQQDIILLKTRGGGLNLSFLIVRSNFKTLHSFIKFRQRVAIGEFSETPSLIKEIPENFLKETDIIPLNFNHVCTKNENANIYFNINVFDYDCFRMSNVLSLQTKNLKWNNFLFASSMYGLYLAEYFCIAKQNKKIYKTFKEKFEAFNPGMSNALVTLYTKEISACGIISEENFKRFCKNNGITLYIYRDIPISMENKKISGTWCKPFVLLNHIKDHNCVAWIDGDIIIGRHYKINFNEDILLYQDPGNWHFNAGFMGFKNTEKNVKMLQSIAEDFSNPEKDLSSTYVGGSDQAVFNDYIKTLYPNYIPLDSSKGNTHPLVYSIKPEEKDNHLIHFMGLPFHVREILMKAFDLDI